MKSMKEEIKDFYLYQNERPSRYSKIDILVAIKALISEDAKILLDDRIFVTGRDIHKYCDTAIEEVEKKTIKNKKWWEEKKKNLKIVRLTDPLEENIYELLTDEPQTIEDITEQLEGIYNTMPTRSQITYRLTALVKKGVAYRQEKMNPRMPGKRNKVYLLAKGEN